MAAASGDRHICAAVALLEEDGEENPERPASEFRLIPSSGDECAPSEEICAVNKGRSPGLWQKSAQLKNPDGTKRRERHQPLQPGINEPFNDTEGEGWGSLICKGCFWVKISCFSSVQLRSPTQICGGTEVELTANG